MQYITRKVHGSSNSSRRVAPGTGTNAKISKRNKKKNSDSFPISESSTKELVPPIDIVALRDESDALLNELVHHRVLANDFERRLRELESHHQRTLLDVDEEEHQNSVRIAQENALLRNLVVDSMNKQAQMHDKMENVIRILYRLYNENPNVYKSLSNSSNNNMSKFLLENGANGNINNTNRILDSINSNMNTSDHYQQPIGNMASSGSNAVSTVDGGESAMPPPLARLKSISNMGDENYNNLVDFLQLDIDGTSGGAPLSAMNSFSDAPSRSNSNFQSNVNGETASGGGSLSNIPSFYGGNDNDGSIASGGYNPNNVDYHVVGGGPLSKQYSSFEAAIKNNIIPPFPSATPSRQPSSDYGVGSGHPSSSSGSSIGGDGLVRRKSLQYDPTMPPLLNIASVPEEDTSSNLRVELLDEMQHQSQNQNTGDSQPPKNTRSRSITSVDSGSVDADGYQVPNKRTKFNPTSYLLSTPAYQNALGGNGPRASAASFDETASVSSQNSFNTNSTHSQSEGSIPLATAASVASGGGPLLRKQSSVDANSEVKENTESGSALVADDEPEIHYSAIGKSQEVSKVLLL